MTIKHVVHRIRLEINPNQGTHYVMFQPTKTFRLDDVVLVNADPKSCIEGRPCDLEDDIAYVQIGHDIQSKFRKHGSVCNEAQQITIVLDCLERPAHWIVVELRGRELW